MSDFPQAIVTPITPAAVFLVLTIDVGAESAVRDVLGQVDALRRSVGFRLPEGGLTCVTAIGSDAWDRLFTGARPAELHPFRALHGPRHTAPATPGDVLFHIRAERLDLCFELARQLVRACDGAARVVDEVHGFRSFDERDLLGFVDGTESPAGAKAAVAALVGDEDPAFAGGSYVMIQKYVHDLSAWEALSVEEQELAVGRTKLEDIEMPDAVKPPSAHIVLNQVNDADGNQLSLVRFNMPFGSVGDGVYGTYYIGYSASPTVSETMLENMFLGGEGGATDRLLDFSTALTGGMFFAPAADQLEDLAAGVATPQVVGGPQRSDADPGPDPGPAPAPATASAPAPAPAPGDGSLGIGNLRNPKR